jgi:hypothetical protein
MKFSRLPESNIAIFKKATAVSTTLAPLTSTSVLLTA